MRKELNVYFKVMDDVTRPIYRKLRNDRYDNVRCWLRKEDVKPPISFARDLNKIEYGDTNHALVCYNWNIYNAAVTPEYDGLQHLMERTLNQQLEFVCIDNTAPTKAQLVLFQDAPHEVNYPKEFVKVPCFDSYDDLIAYAQSHGVFDFSLEDEKHFAKCTGIKPVQGASVYQEKSTGYYWYLDMFHKTHYEVFDKTMNHHLGEADMNGNLDTAKSDPTKHLK